MSEVKHPFELLDGFNAPPPEARHWNTKPELPTQATPRAVLYRSNRKPTGN